jgi:hypothetical protein
MFWSNFCPEGATCEQECGSISALHTFLDQFRHLVKLVGACKCNSTMCTAVLAAEILVVSPFHFDLVDQSWSADSGSCHIRE